MASTSLADLMGWTGGPEGGAGASPWWNQGAGAFPYLTSGKFGAAQLARESLLNLISGGGMNPMGNDSLVNLMRSQGMQDVGGMQRASYMRGRLTAPDDPSLAGYSGLKGYWGGMDTLMKALTNARLSSAQSNQDFLRQMGLQYLGGQYQMGAAKASRPNPWATIGQTAAPVATAALMAL